VGKHCSTAVFPDQLASVSIAPGDSGEIIMEGVRLYIPPGALMEPVTIRAGMYTLHLCDGLFRAPDPSLLGQGTRRSGPNQNVSFHSDLIDFKPDGLSFLKPVTLEMIAVTDGSNLRIATFDEDMDQWATVASSTQASQDVWAKAQIDHFSLYAIVDVPRPTSTAVEMAATTPPATTPVILKSAAEEKVEVRSPCSLLAVSCSLYESIVSMPLGL